jgi:hypothetical protein
MTNPAEPPPEATPIAASITPPTRITVPDFVDFHMISDDELTQLSRPEAGLLGTIGWAAAGAAAGFLIGTAKAATSYFTTSQVRGEDGFASLLFVAAAVTALICLSIYFQNRRNLISISERIRNRQQRTS